MEHVVDVTDATFEQDVLERSKSLPVVVDFWASWCGPCRALGPLLERLAAEYAGQFVLAKVDVDANPQVAAAFRVQSIPMVLGLRRGEIVAEFVGAQPEAAVREFLARVLPDEAEKHAVLGQQRLDEGQGEAAEAEFRKALDLDPRSGAALVGLAEVLAQRDVDGALGLLDRVDPGPDRAAADRLAARLRITQAGGADAGELRRRIETDPTDLESRFLLAQALSASEEYEEALAGYLEIVRRDRAFRDDGARKAMLDIFELLGAAHPLVDSYRSELAKVLFR